MPRESIQQKIDRVRPPLVRITYDVACGSSIEEKELPFVIGVLSDLSGITIAPQPRLSDRKFVEIDLDNFNDVLTAMQPRLKFMVDDVMIGGERKLAVELRFRHIYDFEPASVIDQVKPLANLLEMRQRLAGDKATGNENITEIASLDNLLSRQLNQIMHAQEFQKLEASWRGLYYLVSQTETGPMLKIRVLNISKRDLLRDLQRADEFDQSALFKKVYEEAYGTFGGVPFGALIGDYEFGRHQADIELLEKLSHVAATAYTPFIAAASPQLFNLESFAELAWSRDLAAIFDSDEYTRWRAFRDSEDSRYVGLTMPRILMRLPYVPRPTPVSMFQFAEDIDNNGGLFLWGNAAYAFGACLMNAFAKYHWCAAIRGVEGGGLVEGLPVGSFKTDEGETALKSPLEIAITDRREKELADLGVIPLIHCKGTDYAAFFSVQSCQRPHTYFAYEANANARLAIQLQCMMTTSRFAHYLKCMTRDSVGSFKTRGDYERFLNKWISNYVNLDDAASPMVEARFPLREARIDVSEVPGKPGVYKAVVFLRPHFQLDDLSVSLRLVVELPSPVHL